MEFYMAVYEYGCKVWQNLRSAHFQEVGLTQILEDHGSETVVNDCQG